MELFSVYSDTVQIQFLHDWDNTIFADMDSILGKDGANFFSAKSLFAAIKDLFDLKWKLVLFVFIFSLICTAENMVIGSPSCYTKHTA